MFSRFTHQKSVFQVITLLIILAGTAVSVYLALHPQIFNPRASNDQTRIEFVDGNGNPISNTTSPNVKIKLTYVAPTSTTSVQGVSTTNGKLIAQAGSGTIAASPNPCTITSGTTCSSTITWNTTGVPDTVSVYVDGNLFAQGRFGSQEAPWIDTKGKTFELRDNNGASLGSVAVNGITVSTPPSPTLPPKTATIAASPNPCILGTGADSFYCSSTITWSAVSYPKVALRVNTNIPGDCVGYKLVAAVDSGSISPNWIPSSGYTFYLNSDTDNTSICTGSLTGTSLGSITVTTMSATPTLVSTYPTPTLSLQYFPTAFRLANSQSELASAQEQTFDTNGKIIDWTLSPGIGQKTVYADFKVDGVWQNVVSATITLSASIPTQIPTVYSTFFVGPNYYATGTNFNDSSFIGKYQDPNVQNTVKSQLQSMADNGATVIKTVIWLATGDPDDERGWVSTIPLSKQQQINIYEYARDVASIQAKDGHRLDLYFAFAYNYCADYNTVKSNGTVGECGLTWSQFTDKTKESYTTLINNVSDIRRGDGQKVVKIIYLKHEVMVGTDQLPNEGRFLQDLYPDFVQKVSAAGITPSIYFQASMPEDFLLEANFTDGQYPALNGHKSMYWVWRTTEFMKQNNLPIPDRIDYSLYIDGNSKSSGIPSNNYSTFVKKVLDDTEALYPGKKIGVVETHYVADKTQRDSIGQAFANEHIRRPSHNPEAVIFWTAPDGGANGNIVGFPFDLSSYLPTNSVSSSVSPQSSSSSITGDINKDGKVNGSDINILIQHFGKTGSNAQGDINGDGKVDIFDYNILVENFEK